MYGKFEGFKLPFLMKLFYEAVILQLKKSKQTVSNHLQAQNGYQTRINQSQIRKSYTQQY